MTKCKIQPGRCGICGTAQIQPTGNELLTFISQKLRATNWLSGHLYDDDGILLRVRCFTHVEKDDSRHPNWWDGRWIQQ